MTVGGVKGEDQNRLFPGEKAGEPMRVKRKKRGGGGKKKGKVQKAGENIGRGKKKGSQTKLRIKENGL